MQNSGAKRLKHTHFNILNQWNVKNVFVSTKPLHVSVFFHDHIQGIFTYKHVFNILLVLNVEVSVF